MKVRAVFLLPLCTLLGYAILTQTAGAGELEGRVFYAESNRMAVGVLVKLFSKTGAMVGQALTDPLGTFAFSYLPDGGFRVEVSETGFETASVDVFLFAGFQAHKPIIVLERKSAAPLKPPGQVVSVREMQIPGKARKAYRKGKRELYQKNRPRRSLRHFQKSIELHPEYDEAYVEMGLAHAELAEYSKAEQVLEKAVVINPLCARAYTLLGIVYRIRGENHKAVHALEEAAEIDPASWLVQKDLGAALLEIGRPEEAFQHASRAHDLNPRAESVQLLFYKACVREHKYQTALAELDEFITFHPQSPAIAQVILQREKLKQYLEVTSTKK